MFRKRSTFPENSSTLREDEYKEEKVKTSCQSCKEERKGNTTNDQVEFCNICTGSTELQETSTFPENFSILREDKYRRCVFINQDTCNRKGNTTNDQVEF